MEAQLESREKQLLKLISEAEQELSSKIEENNQLEASALLQSYSYFKQEQPKKLQQVFADMESSIYDNSSAEKIQEKTDDLNQKASELEENAEEIKSQCESKREHLLDLLRQVNSIRMKEKEEEKNELRTPQFNSNCSQEVEDLARQFASTIDDVDEEKLVALLARGESEVDMDGLVEKAKRIAQLKYLIKCETIVNNTLYDANIKLQDMSNEAYPDIGEGAEELANVFSDISERLKNLATEEHAESVDDESTEQLERIDELNAELEGLRARLMSSITSESSIPLPAEISNVEQEKESMRECINVLSQSTASFIDYLNKIDSESIIGTCIASEEEIRETLRMYEDLKQRA